MSLSVEQRGKCVQLELWLAVAGSPRPAVGCGGAAEAPDFRTSWTSTKRVLETPTQAWSRTANF